MRAVLQQAFKISKLQQIEEVFDDLRAVVTIVYIPAAKCYHLAPLFKLIYEVECSYEIGKYVSFKKNTKRLKGN